MTATRFLLHLCAAAFLLSLSAALPALATERPAEVPKKAGIVERLNENVNLDLEFTTQNGKRTALRELLAEGRPAIITPVYYGCPNLCTLTLNGTLKMLQGLSESLNLGKDYTVLTVSIDPDETAELAREKAENYYSELGDPAAGRAGWHFLTGQEENIKQLMQQLGFIYEKDGSEYMHTAAIMVISPLGKISRYLYGVEYPPATVKYSLVEAAQGRIGSSLDRVFLYCFSYDPTTGQYTPVIMNLVRVVGLGVLALLTLTLAALKLKERTS